MILAVDTHYSNICATTAGVTFASIEDVSPVSEYVVTSPGPPSPYVPGQFYKRELPEILRVMDKLPAPPSLILIDGYCTLDELGAQGLGAHLHSELGKEIDIIGVAKTAFKGSAHATEVLRGKSKTPLYITACGRISQASAADLITRMHGLHRIPHLLKRVDQLCRGIAEPK